MKDMLFSAEPVTELNRLVQSQLASHLFLCCNYNPLKVSGLSEDGKFFPAITNLYRIVSDCSCIVKRLNKFSYPVADREVLKELKRSVEFIDMLRSVVTHNNSRYNGRREAEKIDDYHCWIQKILGKQEPDCPNDYAALLAELNLIGDKVYSLLEKCIISASTHAHKEEIIKEWESFILDWYCGKNVKRDIFLGVLEDEYLSRVPLMDADCMHFRVASWIQNYYTRETDLENVRKYYAGIRNEQLQAYIDQKQAEIDNQITATAEQFNMSPPHCFVEKFFTELKGD